MTKPQTIKSPKPGALFFDVDDNGGGDNQVVCYRVLSDFTIIGYEVALVSAYGEWWESKPRQRVGEDGEPCRSEKQAHSDAHELAGALNGAAVIAGVFDDSLPEALNRQRKNAGGA